MNWQAVHGRVFFGKGGSIPGEGYVEYKLTLMVDHVTVVLWGSRDRDRNGVHLSWNFLQEVCLGEQA